MAVLELRWPSAGKVGRLLYFRFTWNSVQTSGRMVSAFHDNLADSRERVRNLQEGRVWLCAGFLQR